MENQISTWLSQEALVGGEVEADVWVSLEPVLVLLMGVEIVEDGMDSLSG